MTLLAVDHSLLGTVVRVSAEPRRRWSRHNIADRALDEMRRLERVFNRFDRQSEVSRLQVGEQVQSEPLRQLLAEAAGWYERTNGIFDPCIGSKTGSLPWASERVGDRTLVTVSADPSTIDLNAIAKGWIVDRAADLIESRAQSLVIDAGGDITHRGEGAIAVGVEDPSQPYDNVAPLMTVRLSNEAIATSGSSRRGPHLIDPRTGRAVESTVAATVIAPSAATADVLATTVAVLGFDEGLSLADDLEIAACVIGSAQSVDTSTAWTARFQ